MQKAIGSNQGGMIEYCEFRIIHQNFEWIILLRNHHFIIVDGGAAFEASSAF